MQAKLHSIFSLCTCDSGVLVLACVWISPPSSASLSHFQFGIAIYSDPNFTNTGSTVNFSCWERATIAPIRHRSVYFSTMSAIHMNSDCVSVFGSTHERQSRLFFGCRLNNNDSGLASDVSHTHRNGIAMPLVVCDSSHRSGQHLSTTAWCPVVPYRYRPSVRYTRTPFQILWPLLYRHDIISLLSSTLFASLWPSSPWSCISPNTVCRWCLLIYIYINFIHV